MDSPAHATRHVDIVHEAFDREWDAGSVGRHLLLQLFAFIQQTQPSTRVGFGIDPVVLLEFLLEVVANHLIEVEATNFQIKNRFFYTDLNE